MYVKYFHWQFVVAPAWLLELFWNIQRALLQFFSVVLLVRTLFAHWHKDRVSYKQGSISGFFQALAWNSISRVIGFIVRLTVLFLWLSMEVIVVVVASGGLILFILWPFLVLGTLAIGVALLRA